ncbi:MAG: nuclear transport factor 2 family protein [Flavobacteriales bacterium]|nr:nuclear transport factor 2 family protein [Flavobacteriales bacterium]
MTAIARFYTAFAQRDWATMGACYHHQGRFGDPAFPDLDADGVRAMWKMLVTGGKDLRITFTVVEENESGGKAHWDAYYTFSKDRTTGAQQHHRQVHLQGWADPGAPGSLRLLALEPTAVRPCVSRIMIEVPDRTSPFNVIRSVAGFG